MPSKKTHLNLAVEHALKDALQRQADKEGRSLGNLGELLIKWAHRQLQIAANSVALLEIDIDPSRSTTDLVKEKLIKEKESARPSHANQPRKKAG